MQNPLNNRLGGVQQIKAQVNDRRPNPDLDPRHVEYRSEMYHRFFDLPGLFLRPNIRYILDPGDYTRASNA